MSKNKVKYGLKNVHYALLIEGEEGITYGTPIKINGGVSLALTPKGEKTEFFADDVAYYVAESNQGYEGTLEVALVPDQFRKDVLSYKEDANGVLFEDANATIKNIALLFEFSGDQNAIRHVLYNVNVGRPNVESTTKGANIEVKTEIMNITAAPSIENGKVKAKIEPGKSQYNTWFESVYTYTEEE